MNCVSCSWGSGNQLQEALYTPQQSEKKDVTEAEKHAELVGFLIIMGWGNSTLTCIRHVIARLKKKTQFKPWFGILKTTLDSVHA